MTTYYEKRGRRYYPVREWDDGLLNALPEGSHLVTVRPGVRSVHHKIDPDNAAVLAALKAHSDQLATLMVEASKSRPHKRLLSPAERRGMAAYYEHVGKNSLLMLEYPSAQEIIDTLEREVVRLAEGEK